MFMGKNIVVIGKSGQVAWELAQLNTDHCLNFYGRNEIDITSMDSIDRVLGSMSIDAIINASAYTAVDLAEEEVEQAFAINATAVKNLAEFCKVKMIHFTHISTDYVFGGDKGSPYLPEDEYNPQSVYGESKMEGEKEILAIYPDNSCIIRTSWVYSSHGNNFVKTILRLLREKEELNVIDDQIGSPTYAVDLAKACLKASESNITGIYHWTDEGICSWYDFAIAIQNQALVTGLITNKILIKPISTSAYPTAAKRPHYSVLNKIVSRKYFDTNVAKHWQENLLKCIKKLSSENNVS
jgi:dTDP-4-dehydrorhamnose reductase